MVSKKVQEALKTARELEKREPMPKEKVLEIEHETGGMVRRALSLLAPSWFIKDVHSKKTKKRPKNI